MTTASFSHASLTILHTSDWHLGRRLYGKTRYQEFKNFLDWLLEQIKQHKVDILVVAGDVFDTMTPSHTAQTLYYQFLNKVAQSCCQNVVIIAGNHDSPSFLDAPKDLLKVLNVHVIGTACDDLDDEVIVLYQHQYPKPTPQDTPIQAVSPQPIAIIGAVPYLRDKDIRTTQAGESNQDKERQVIEGIKAHYDDITQIALKKQQEIQKSHHKTLPIIMTGHLFTSGGKTTEDDGVRDLYVGSLGHISAELFSQHLDYVALGHLHVPQMVSGHSHIRYSGSPIAMGFGEANQQKQVCLVRFFEQLPDNLLIDDKINSPFSLSACQQYRHIEPIFVPNFQQLQQIKGDWQDIKNQLNHLKKQSESIWLEIVYDDEVLKSQQNLKENIDDLVKDSQIEVLKIKNSQTYRHVMQKSHLTHTLKDLTEMQVFEQCLQVNDISENTQVEHLKQAFSQILHEIYHDDKNL